ncbi:hypothetical protein ACWCQS_29435 [Streptomyces sp. NPDC002076]
MVLGVGTGWDRAEFDTVGVPLAGRGRRTDEPPMALPRLWRGEDGAPRLGVLPRAPAARPCGSAAGATRPCTAPCGTAPPGTARGSTPSNSGRLRGG